MALTLWLLIFGVNEERWRARAKEVELVGGAS
jgi:hypothetical protein